MKNLLDLAVMVKYILSDYKMLQRLLSFFIYGAFKTHIHQNYGIFQKAMFVTSEYTSRRC